MSKKSYEKFFWSKVLKTETCWLWKGGLTTNGYGRFGKKPAHRKSWEYLKGEIPANLVIDHLCRIKACVNPDHLEPVTDRTNTLRGMSPAAFNARKTYCYRGHKFDVENMSYRKNKRHCRICARITTKKIYMEKNRKSRIKHPFYHRDYWRLKRSPRKLIWQSKQDIQK